MTEPNSEKKSNKLKLFITILLTLYFLGMGIYAGHIAHINQPNDGTNGLFLASYIICIIQSIIYVLGSISIPFIMYSDYNVDKEMTSLLLNIYWVVIFFGEYKISSDYEIYALVKTIEFFTFIAILFVILCGACILIYTDCYKIYDSDTNIKNEKTNIQNV